MNTFINGINLYYEDQGEGPIMILLHGNGENSGIFSRTVSYFKKTHRVISIDSRAHGHSDRGKGRLTIALMAKDVLAFIKAKYLDEIILVGFSDGGNIALEVASQSDKIKTLVVIGANMYPLGLRLFPLWGVWLTRLYTGLLFFIPSFRRKFQLYGLMSRQPKLTNAKLKRIKARTLIMAGKRDIVSPSHTRKIHRKIKDSKLCIIPKADHFLIQKNNAKVNEIIAEFLKE